MRIICIGSATLLSLLILMRPALAKGPDERISDLEKRVTLIQQTYLTNNADVAKAISQANSVAQDFAALKGLIETNAHQIESQGTELKRLINDLEARLQAIEDRLEIFSTQINTAIGKISPAAAEEGKLYQEGLDKITKGEYLTAAADFQNFKKRFPKSAFASDAQYWIGECFYSMRDYKRAIKEFQLFIQNNPRNDKAALALLKQGNSFYELGFMEEAKPFYQKVIKTYPATEEALQADAKLKRIEGKKLQGAGQTAPTTQSEAPSLSSYPQETIEQQRSKYKYGTSIPPTSKPLQKKNERYIEF